MESASVISILVSASFLKAYSSILIPFVKYSCFQIEDLVEECLEYVYKNMNQILTVTPTFSCVGDTLLTRYDYCCIFNIFIFASRLARFYKPSEIENLSDRRDRIHNRLYTRVRNNLSLSLQKQPNE